MTCSSVIRSDRSTSAKTAATKGCRLATSVARDAPIRCRERNQSTFVSTSGPTVAKARSSQTLVPTTVVLLRRLRKADEGDQHPGEVSTTALIREAL